MKVHWAQGNNRLYTFFDGSYQIEKDGRSHRGVVAYLYFFSPTFNYSFEHSAGSNGSFEHYLSFTKTEPLIIETSYGTILLLAFSLIKQELNTKVFHGFPLPVKTATPLHHLTIVSLTTRHNLIAAHSKLFGWIVEGWPKY